jgi:hypothetical protein
MLVLLAIAASATARGGGSNPPPGAGIASTAGHHVLVVATIVLFPILAVLGLVLVFYAQIMKRRERDPEVLRRRRQARAVAFALLAVSLGMLIYALRHGRLHLHFPGLFSSFAGGHARAPQIHRPHAGGGAIAGTDWTAATIVWVLLVIAAVFAYTRIRARKPAAEPLHLPEDVFDGEEPDLDAVRRERNPRRAVIAAYALMERLMARDGLARGPHEAPVEYLGRVTLNGHRGAGSVHRLTALFQRARFGHRPVDEEMRERAIAAVEELDAATGGTA